VWGDRVFLTGAEDGENGRRAVFAVDTSTGDVLWTRWYSAKEHRKHQLNSFASATPTVDAGHVYVSWTTPDAYFVKALTHDGNDVWSCNLGPFVSQHSGGASLVKSEDLLIVINEQDAEGGGKSSWLALDSKTGDTIWHTPRTSDVVIYSTPCERKTEDGAIELVFNSQPHGITGINPRTGKVNWELSDLFDKRTVSSPIIAAGELVIGTCGSGGGGNYVVAVRPGSANQSESAVLKYKITRQAPYVPTPIALDDLLFLWSDAGIVSCVEARTGENVWTKRIGGTYYGSPVCIDRRLFCTDVTGNVVVLAAEREFKELAQNALDELCHSTPAVANGSLFVRTFGTLHCIGKK
jgi:outer membrane protein assembly factor BamB